MEFSKKTGAEIAAALSARTRKRVEFEPYPRNLRARYDLKLRNDDLFNALNYLDKRGKVKFDGMDFGKLKMLRKDLKDGKRVSVNFMGITAAGAISRLAFASGKAFTIKSGDPAKIISLNLQDVTLSEIVARISMTAGVEIGK